METIAERLKSVQATIKQSALDTNRPTNAVKLLAVSKTKPVSNIVQAYEVGQRLFGENYVQEGVEKVLSLSAYGDIEWHFIGPLQSNKTKAVAEHFDWVQSVDRLKIAQRLNDQRTVHKQLNVCIQVNIDGDPNKAGVDTEEVFQLAEAITAMPNLRLRGLMTIPKASYCKSEQVTIFTKMSDLFKRLENSYKEVDTLSMGMSGDMQAAIQCDSTMVRVGSGIFGPRS